MGRALVFSGQGAQFVGMGKDLCEAYPECRALYEQANEVLGFDLAGICFDGPEEELTKTSNCQPAIFVTSAACYAALRREIPDLACEGLAGLSLGEWTALHVAGALPFAETVKLLEARGRFMQQACDARAGGMLSVIGLDTAALETICTQAGVEISNVNSAEQTVLSGTREGIEKAESLAKEAGAKRAIPLRVAGAYHSSLMRSAAEQLDATLAEIRIGQTDRPVIANVTGEPHGSSAEIRTQMVRQVTSSVQWLASIQWFKAHGVSEYVECGPGRVLSGLIKRIDKGAAVHNIQDLQSLKSTVEALRPTA